MSLIKSFIETETRFAATGTLAGGADSSRESYGARVSRADFILAEALQLTDPNLDPLQRARTLLARGALGLAEEILNSLADKFLRDPNARIELGEVFLEKARLASFRAQWKESELFATQALALEVPAVTQMTLRQVRAVTLFEQGELAAALREIELGLSLAQLFPFGTQRFYARVTQIKILIHLGQVSIAGSKLAALWIEFKEADSMNLDNCLVLMRAEIELCRAQGCAVADLAGASFKIAMLTGDRLYAGLALVDLFHSLALDERAVWIGSLRLATNEFERLRILQEEIESGDHLSQSAKSIASAVKCKSAFEPGGLEAVDTIVLIRQQIVVRNGIQHFTATPQMLLALRCFGRGRIGKDELFKRVWGSQKYVDHLHDSVVRTLLRRMRNATGFRIESANNEIEMPKTLLVDI